mgnify:CR=1 FL=1
MVSFGQSCRAQVETFAQRQFNAASINHHIGHSGGTLHVFRESIKGICLNIFRLLGFIFLGVAIIGIFLPLLPTTPFVLLATACFARSSEKWHRWMLENDTFGPMIRNWEQNRCISCRVKLIAVGSMVLVGGYSMIFAVQSTNLRIAGGIFIAAGLLTVLLIKTCERR